MRLSFFVAAILVSSVFNQGNAADTAQTEKLLAIKACEKCDLRSANLQKEDLQRAEIDYINLEGANLEGTDLSYSKMDEVNLSKVDGHANSITLLDGLIGSPGGNLLQRQ